MYFTQSRGQKWVRQHAGFYCQKGQRPLPTYFILYQSKELPSRNSPPFQKDSIHQISSPKKILYIHKPSNSKEKYAQSTLAAGLLGLLRIGYKTTHHSFSPFGPRPLCQKYQCNKTCLILCSYWARNNNFFTNLMSGRVCPSSYFAFWVA